LSGERNLRVADHLPAEDLEVFTVLVAERID
jgi:hypothetical protein